MKRAIIFTNGYNINYEYYKDSVKSDDYIICADGAINHCIKMNIIPNLWIGDFDSCDFKSILKNNPQLNDVEIMKLNPVKDETDTHKCCMVALERGFRQIHIWCAMGNRTDHMMANIHLLEFLHQNDAVGIIEDAKNHITLCSDEIIIEKKHKYISLIPLDSSVFVEKTQGLLYQLENFKLLRSISMGVSNEFISDTAFLKIKDGLMIIIQSDD